MANRTTRQKKTGNLERRKLCKAVCAAAERAGQQYGDKGLVSYLEAQAVATPGTFINLLSKVLQEYDETNGQVITRIEIVAPKQSGKLS